ncbi:MAG: double-stranded DNA-binding protein [Thaumarchaeota archaeon]|nr:double-stranded DNA-binding protein [Nitrososphaerota archaeon]
MSEDPELEKLKAKRLAEMQRNISSQKQTPSLEESEEKETKSPREVVVNYLGFRGVEVLENAETQFPKDTKSIVEQLAKLIESGELDEKMDGGQLLAVFRSIGLRVRMNTTINIEQDGKFVSLSEKLSSSKNNDDQ